MVSLLCDLLCKLSIYTLKSGQKIAIWWAKFELECLLLIFIYSNYKFKAICKMTLNVSTSELIPKKKHLKFLTLHLPFCLFLIKILKLNCHPEYAYFGFYFTWGNRQMCIKMVHSNTKKANSRVHQSHVCYLHTTHSSTLYSWMSTTIIFSFKSHTSPRGVLKNI